MCIKLSMASTLTKVDNYYDALGISYHERHSFKTQFKHALHFEVALSFFHTYNISTFVRLGE